MPKSPNSVASPPRGQGSPGSASSPASVGSKRKVESSDGQPKGKHISDEKMKAILAASRFEMTQEMRKRALKELLDKRSSSQELLDCCTVGIQKHERASIVRTNLPRNVRSQGTFSDAFVEEILLDAYLEELGPYIQKWSKTAKGTLLELSTDWQMATTLPGREL